MLRFQVAEPTRSDFDRLERRQVRAEAVGPVELANIPDEAGDDNGFDDNDEAVAIFDPALLLAPEPDQGGGSEICVDARTLAIYFHEKQLSIAQAKEKYGLGRRIHTRHRDFALELVGELKSLQSGNPPQSPYYRTSGGAL